MAIVQISRIQIRRGLQQDLPQLASAEMGWSLDTQRLFIGNGLTTEGAPTAGVTEILTSHSNILSLLGIYTYQGAASGVTAITGPDGSHPITRTFQQKLDDIVNVRDFGAVGDGITDDTVAINRAIQQIYNPVYNDTSNKVRRTLNFPAGSYLVSSTILIPPYASLRGDGRENTLLVSANVTAPVLQSTDSQYNGTGTTKSRDILIENLGIQQTGNASLITSSALVLDGTRAARLVNLSFRSNTTVGATTNNLVYITDNVQSSRSVTFEQCSFTYAGSGVNVVSTGSGVSSVRIDNCYFNNLSNVAYYTSDSVSGISTLNNYYGSVGTVRKLGVNGNLTSIGGFAASTPTGLILGQLQTGVTTVASIPTGTATQLVTLSNGAGSIDYQLSNSSTNAYRYGTVQFTVNGSAATYQDDYTETGTGLGGNLHVNASGYLSCSVTSAAILKYNLRQFIS
jgi:polygalacturonase